MNDNLEDNRPVSPRSSWLIALAVVGSLLLLVVSFLLLRTTAGVGGVATGIVLSIAATLFFAQRAGHSWHRQLWTAARTMTIVLLVWSLVSSGRYVLHNNGDTSGQRMTSWGRNHGLGFVIDRLETAVYSQPPAKQPAKDLGLALPAAAATTTTETASSTPSTTHSDSAAAATSTTIPADQPPAPLKTYFAPALAGEGQWLPAASAGGHVAMWATSLRPLQQFGEVVASMVVIKQSYVRAAMFNGSELPGGQWTRGNKIPKALYSSLTGVMNGGFRLSQSFGGYMTEGKVVQTLIDGRATLAIDHSGKIKIGEYGRDLTNDGTWETLRQNLVLMVDGGQSGLERAKRDHIFWGAEYGGVMYDSRSAICTIGDGSLAYVMADKVNAEQMAGLLINVGCVTAMQLDVNGDWPNFLLYEHGVDGKLTPHRLDKRMSGNPQRYVNGSTKEFFGFFDSALVPAGSVLDK
jgi:hypothetical protein